MKTFIVNLKQSADRRERMQTVLKDFPYEWEFFEAVDGREIKNVSEVYDEKKALRFHKTPLKAGELGCVLSHLKIYKKMIDEGIDRALILEDDIALEKDFYPVLATLTNTPMHNDVFMLGHSGYFIRKKLFGKKITDTHCLKQIINSGNGTFGYMIDLPAAKKLYRLNFPVKLTADDWYIFSNFINIYIVEPSVVDFRIENYHSIITEIDDRWPDKPPLLRHIKKSGRISVFFKIAYEQLLRIAKGILRRITYAIEAPIFAVLPEKRIE